MKYPYSDSNKNSFIYKFIFPFGTRNGNQNKNNT